MERMKFEITLDVGDNPMQCGLSYEAYFPTETEIKDYLLHCVSKQNPYDSSRYLHNAKVTQKRK